MAENDARKFIPSLREGIDVVKMIFFQELKQSFTRQYPEEGAGYPGMLAAAVMNELFGTPNPGEKFVRFAGDNRQRIVDELHNVGQKFPDLRILLTDALRMHFLCNHQEGIQEGNEQILRRAEEYGVLLTARTVPLPRGFMEMVHRVGRVKGIIVG
ncbi:MAG: hypothetical protein ACOY32_06135 [Thermodesulfobacteriota bacterium]